MRHHSKALIKQLDALGFDRVWTNAQGYHCYVHPGDARQEELSVSPSISNENTARTLLRRAQRIAGFNPDTGKRRAGVVKERAADHRQRVQARLAWTRTKAATAATAAEREALQALVAERERELAAIERLMTQTPSGSAIHHGTSRARHRAGAA